MAVLVEHYEQRGRAVLRLLAEETRVAALATVVESGREVHREWCETVFATTLAPLRGAARRRRLAQLMAVCDVFTWRLLRLDAGLSRHETERALVELLTPLTEVPR